MKKQASVLAILAIAMVISFSFSVRTARANEDYSIEHVSHKVELMYNGCIFINDTIKLNITGQSPNDFLMGFPDKYGAYVLRCVAYSGSETYSVTLNVPLDNRVGFYGMKVDFPQGAPQIFTVVVVLSNNLLAQDAANTSRYALDFPAYPSLTRVASVCNVSIAPPKGAIYAGGTVEAFEYGQENLPEFTHSPKTLGFLLVGEQLQIIDIAELKREIKINEFGRLEGSDTYQIVNKADKKVDYIEVFLPANASDLRAEDQFGRTIGTPRETDKNTSRYGITLNLPVEYGRSTWFTVKYGLPSQHIEQKGGSSFATKLSIFPHLNYYINRTSVSLVLPEGAKLITIEGNFADDVSSMTRSVFQESVTMNREGILEVDNLSIGITYEYNPVWLSFRPTIWVWTLALVGTVVVTVAWRRPRGPTRIPVLAAAAKLRPEHLKAFVDAYEEKKKINLELDSLEARVQKGKIPRRRYKVRRKMLETRLDALNRDLSEFREKTRAVGGQYSDLMRQLEIAETEINEAGTNIKSIDARHNRGELSLEAYRKLLSDYQRRKGNAETAINGILLRLREETR